RRRSCWQLMPPSTPAFPYTTLFRSALWFEELAEFAGVEDIDVVEDTFIRADIGGGRQVRVYYSYNPPRNPYSWVNEWRASKEGDPDYFLHHSTYLEDKKGFLSDQLLRK